MIVVTLFKNKEGFYGFRSKGHADYDEYGRDIVCAAVSFLTHTTYRSAVVNCQLNDGDYSYREIEDDDESLMEFISRVQDDRLDLIIKTLLEGVKSLVEGYGQFVRLEMEE